MKKKRTDRDDSQYPWRFNTKTKCYESFLYVDSDGSRKRTKVSEIPKGITTWGEAQAFRTKYLESRNLTDKQKKPPKKGYKLKIERSKRETYASENWRIDKKTGRYITFGYYDPVLKKNCSFPVGDVPETIFTSEAAQEFRNSFLKGKGAIALRSKKQAESIAEFNKFDGWKEEFETWRKKNAKNSYSEDLSRLSNWIFKFFVHRKKVENPAVWPTLYVDFEEWLLSTESERNNTKSKTKKKLSANSVNHICSALNVYLDFLEERRNFAPIRRMKAVFKQSDIPKKTLANLYEDEEIKSASEVIRVAKDKWAEKTSLYWKIIAASGMRANEPLGLHLESVAFGELGEDHRYLVEDLLDALERKGVPYYGFIILKDQPMLPTVREKIGFNVPRKPLKSKPAILPKYNRYIPILDEDIAVLLLDLVRVQDKLFSKGTYGSDPQNYLLLDGLTYSRVYSCLMNSIFEDGKFSGGDGVDRRIHDLRHSFITRKMMPIARGRSLQSIARIWVGQERIETTDRYNHEAEIYENMMKGKIRTQTLASVTIAPVGKKKPG